METLKEKALEVISKMPDSSDIDEIMYQIYVIDKVRKGQAAIQNGDSSTAEDVKKEIETW